MATYSRSAALEDWFGHRRDELRAVEQAHQQVAQASPGAGRPLGRGGDQIAHAFIVRMNAEFQGFVRELHDLAIDALLRASQVPKKHRPPLVNAATDGRRLDQGNAGLDALKRDFRRIGHTGLLQNLSTLNPHHASDRARYEQLIELRNALAHGNANQLRALVARGIKPTLTWGRQALPSLNRLARALDRSVWNHVAGNYPDIDPWGTP